MTQIDTQVGEVTAAEVPAVRGDVSGAWALGTGVAWLVGLQLMYVLEPAPTQPDALPAFLGTAVALAMNVGLLVMAVGLIRRSRWAFGVAAATAVLNVGAVVACPITGHHALGAWWFTQASIAVGLVVLSLAGWQAAARSARAAH
jgi:hypothetical protein